MTFTRFVKALVAGMAFPAVFMPFAYTILYFVDADSIHTGPFQFIPLTIPLVFGLTNVIYVWIGNRCPVSGPHARLWVTGGLLGLLVALFAVFLFHVPELLLGLHHGFEYLPIFVLPVIYGAIFRYIVGWLNRILGVE